MAEQVAREQRSYLLVSLLSEMGGYISLMLGISVLSVADLACKVLRCCRSVLHTAPRPDPGPIPAGMPAEAWAK